MLKFRLQTLMLFILIVALATPRIYDWFQQRPVELGGYSNTELARQLSKDRPVLVLFHASWNLQSQAQLSANSDRIWSIVRDNTMSVMNADCSTKGSQGERLMQQVGISKLPAFAIYSPSDSRNPTVVSELANESNLRSALKQIADIKRDRTKL